MKKRYVKKIALVLALTLIVGVGIYNYGGVNADGRVFRCWFGFTFNNHLANPLPADSATLKAQEELAAKIDAADPSYSRVEALLEKQAVQNMAKTSTQSDNTAGSKRGYKSLETLIATGGYRKPSASGIPYVPDDYTTSQPTTSTSPDPTPTPTTSATPATPTPTPAVTPTIPEPVNTVQYNMETDYAFYSTTEEWIEVWYNTSSLMYLRGSVPADCDTGNRNGWQLSVDMDGETVTIAGDGCVDGYGTSLDVGFMFDDDTQAKLEAYFIQGGVNLPITLKYSDGSRMKTWKLDGQPKLSLCYDGLWLKLYVSK